MLEDEPFRVEVPDDARELDLDVLAWRREQAARARRQRLGRLFLTRRWHRYGLSGPIVVAVLLVVALVGGTVALIVPAGNQPHPRARELDGTATASPGLVGSLLPADLVLHIGEQDRDARDLRPAVVALVPHGGCDCLADVNALSGQAAEYGLRLYLVTPGAQDQGLEAMVRSLRRGHPVAAHDPEGMLQAAFGDPAAATATASAAPSGAPSSRPATSAGRPAPVTVVLVRDDGRVVGTVHGWDRGQRLEPQLVRLAS